jgi:glycosyltransferase involved in cell wall biosynthesis
MLSFIVPAHNEELLLGRTLAAIHAAAGEAGVEYELIVADDASTDGTARIAETGGAQVISVNYRQIAAARNAGARIARGDIFIFVDADTLVRTEVLREILAAIDSGVAGGGCVFEFDGRVPLWARLFFPLFICIARALKYVGGCCMFATREAYEAIGGFCEEYYAGEDAAFITALKRQGPVVIPRALVITSGRKVRTYSGFRILWTLLCFVLRGPKAYRSRSGLDLWYGEQPVDPGFGKSH